MTGPAGGAPYLRVVCGEPTAAELAAVIAVVAARREAALAAVRAPAATPPATRSQWSSKARLVRQIGPTGPGAWRASARRW